MIFYKHTLSLFRECKQRCNVDNLLPNDILIQPIWNNNNIDIKGNTLIFNNWVNSNILYLKDLIDDNGNKKKHYNRFPLLFRDSLISFVNIILYHQYQNHSVKYMNFEMLNIWYKMPVILPKTFTQAFVKSCYQTKLFQGFAIPVNGSNIWKSIYA